MFLIKIKVFHPKPDKKFTKTDLVLGEPQPGLQLVSSLWYWQYKPNLVAHKSSLLDEEQLFWLKRVIRMSCYEITMTKWLKIILNTSLQNLENNLRNWEVICLLIIIATYWFRRSSLITELCFLYIRKD